MPGELNKFKIAPLYLHDCVEVYMDLVQKINLAVNNKHTSTILSPSLCFSLNINILTCWPAMQRNLVNKHLIVWFLSFPHNKKSNINLLIQQNKRGKYDYYLCNYVWKETNIGHCVTLIQGFYMNEPNVIFNPELGYPECLVPKIWLSLSYRRDLKICCYVNELVS